jgi:thioredoxin 1
MMSDVKIVDDSNFDTEVTNDSGLVLVDFGATWCGPCQRQHPILEKFAKENYGRIKVVTVDIDDAPLTVAKLGIRSVPSLLVFEAGNQTGMKVGLTTVAELNNICFIKPIQVS